MVKPRRAARRGARGALVAQRPPALRLEAEEHHGEVVLAR
jgi:hypothetical protein